jgi:hypothetical protein
MRQQGDNSNNIQIGNAGSGNTISVVQNQSRADHALLVVDGSSVREYEKETLRKDRNIGWAKLAGCSLLGPMSLLSDAIGISSHFGFSFWWLLFPVGLIAGMRFAEPHLRSWNILRKLATNKNEAYLAGTNEIVKESENGKIVTYHRSTACIYPNCTGTIILSAAPEREKARLGKDFVGVCSLAERDHSYRIDYIWNAYPADFDWRPVEPNAQKP